jgi:poly-gamma-glutamate synthesis protein (capsule biosynthesis protein)
MIIALVVLVAAGAVAWRVEAPTWGQKGGSMLFVGDMMFDRTIRFMAEEEGGDYFFACVADYLKGFDAVVGNLEGPITANSSVSRTTRPGDDGNTTFTFPTSTAGLLARNGVTAVSLANNHILDFGRAGVGETRAGLRSAGIGYFGDPLDPLAKSTIVRVGGFDVALIGFNQFLGVDSVAGTVAEIARLRGTVDHVIVFAHWGDEYVPANEFQKFAAHAFVDAGADAVIGAHPHVVQEHETYKGALIYYSLGNFIFDQYWEESVRRGMVLEASIGEGGMSFVPRYVVRERSSGPCLLPL